MGKILKRILKLPIIRKIAFIVGTPGYNMIEMQAWRYIRDYTPGELLMPWHHIREINNETGKMGVYRKGGLKITFNARVNQGAALTAGLMSGSNLGGVSSPLPPKYIAISSSTLTPAAGDTTLTGEISTNGFTRVLTSGTAYVAPASLDAAASFQFQNTFTASGMQTVASSALFDAVSAGHMFAEANFSSSTTFSTSDQCTVVWTINI